jgi:PTH1 family peptidyl-tRNA hydrolase
MRLQLNGTYIIVGLGNPGREHLYNRHNIGYMIANKLAERLDTTFTRVQSKALVTDGRYQGNKIILAKPQTYMNRSGEAVSSLVGFYKIPSSHLLVVNDDVDLPFGTLRLRPQGGSGGHRGLKSIINQLGIDDFPRLRIGIDRPPGRMDAADYVLQDFTDLELEILPSILQQASDVVLSFIRVGIEDTMTHYNRSSGQELP